MQGTRRWNTGVAVVIGALAFIFAPLQNAIAQSLTLDEISAIRERALAGKTTQADKRRLYKSLSPEDAHRLLRFQGSSGNIRGASLYRTVVNAVAEINGVDKTKLLAIIDAIIEAEKPPGEDEYRQGLKHLADKQYDLAIPEFDSNWPRIFKFVFCSRASMAPKTKLRTSDCRFNASKPQRSKRRLLPKWRPRFWPEGATFPSGTNINDPYVYRVLLLTHPGILLRNSRAVAEARW